jgi:hypothetical protein
MLQVSIGFLFALFLQDVPNKPSAEYILKFDLKFKSAAASPTKFESSEGGGLSNPAAKLNMPYLTLNLKLLTLSADETRIRVLKESASYINRKIQVNDEVKIDVGFIADIKDKEVANAYQIFFLNDKKQATSQIIVFFDDDGNFFVNGEKRGKI